MITVLTLCAFGAQSQIALEGVPVFPDSVEGGSCREHRVEMRQDTLHITPAMIEEEAQIGGVIAKRSKNFT